MQKSKLNKQRISFVLPIVSILFLLLGVLLIPWGVSNLQSHPRPVSTYEDAVRRILALPSYQSSDMNPLCLVQFMTHGQKMPRSVVFVHGYTNCPQQFSELAQIFYGLGYNVLIVPLPHHGLADRMTEEQAKLKTAELVGYADEIMDISQGLGERKTMIGFSAGGVVTAWAAQQRQDLDLAVIISPVFGFKHLPIFLTAPVMNLVSVLPDTYLWWDQERKSEGGLPHSYPRFSLQGLAQVLKLGFAVQGMAEKVAPATQEILLINNENDSAVNNQLTAEVAENWRKHQAKLSMYDFPADLQLGHDLIDPAQADARIDLVYPRMLELIKR